MNTQEVQTESIFELILELVKIVDIAIEDLELSNQEFSHLWQDLRAEGTSSNRIIQKKIDNYKQCIENAENDSDREFWEGEMEKLNTKFMVGACVTLSNILKLKLKDFGIKCRFTFANVNQTIGLQELDNKDDDTFHIKVAIHRYLVVEKIDAFDVCRFDIIIDPTIGQFINGYHQVFVGTRSQLKELIIKATSQNRIVNTDYPELVFQRAWGDSSV